MAQGKGWNETSDKEPRMTFPDLLKGKNKNSVVSMHCSQARLNTKKGAVSPRRRRGKDCCQDQKAYPAAPLVRRAPSAVLLQA